MFSIQVIATDQSPRRRDGWLARLLRRTGRQEAPERSREGSAPDRYPDFPAAGTESERP